MKQRVLVIDDSPFIRRVLSDWIKSEDDMDLIGTASNGREGVEAVKRLRPDVVTLDVEMPEMDGLTALKEIMAASPTAVIMVSSVTVEGASQTMRALEAGAIDFVTKPQGGASLKFVGTKDELLAKIRGARAARLQATARRPVVRATSRVGTTDQVLLIASSTGGPKALVTLFESLPKGLPVPILIVQHMPVGFTASFAKRLDGLGTVVVKEAAAGDRMAPGLALLAPGGQHMTVDGRGQVSLNQGPTIHGVRPAADHLFNTAAAAFGSRCVGVVLTGMGRDGADGALSVRKAGGFVFGEAEESCVVYGMPRAAMEVGGVNVEHPIDRIGGAIVEHLQGRVRRAS